MDSSNQVPPGRRVVVVGGEEWATVPEYAVGSAAFTNGKPFVVTADDTKKPWSGGKGGEYFRCYLCGHKFEAGDVARWQHTNDVPGAGGNPMVCQKCDGTREEVIEKWKSIHAEYKSPRFWTMRRR